MAARRRPDPAADRSLRLRVGARARRRRGALSARRYAVDGHLVIEVSRRSRLRRGPLRVGRRARPGRRARAATRAADLSMPVDALGSLYAGGVSAHMLRDIGRIDEHRAGAVDRAAVMFSSSTAAVVLDLVLSVSPNRPRRGLAGHGWVSACTSRPAQLGREHLDALRAYPTLCGLSGPSRRCSPMSDSPDRHALDLAANPHCSFANTKMHRRWLNRRSAIALGVVSLAGTTLGVAITTGNAQADRTGVPVAVLQRGPGAIDGAHQRRRQSLRDRGRAAEHRKPRPRWRAREQLQQRRQRPGDGNDHRPGDARRDGHPVRPDRPGVHDGALSRAASG